jgi:hypothetical protein
MCGSSTCAPCTCSEEKVVETKKPKTKRKKKSKWIVSWWDDEKDRLVKRGCDTHEEAMVLYARVQRKYNRTPRVELRSFR